MGNLTIEQYFEKLDKVRIDYEVGKLLKSERAMSDLKLDFRPLLYRNYKHDSSSSFRSKEVAQRISSFGQLEFKFNEPDLLDWYFVQKDDENLSSRKDEFAFSGESIQIEKDSLLLNMKLVTDITADFNTIKDDYPLNHKSIISENNQRHHGDQIWLSVLGKASTKNGIETPCRREFVNNFLGFRYSADVPYIRRNRDLDRLASYLGLSLPLTVSPDQIVRVEIRIMQVLKQFTAFRPTVFSHGFSDRYCSPSWYQPYGNATVMGLESETENPYEIKSKIPRVIGLTEIVAKKSDLRSCVAFDKELSFHRYEEPLQFFTNVPENEIVECLVP